MTTPPAAAPLPPTPGPDDELETLQGFAGVADQFVEVTRQPPAELFSTDAEGSRDDRFTLQQLGRIEEMLREIQGGLGVQGLARLLNGSWVEAELTTGVDTTFEHQLERVPVAVALSVPLAGSQGAVVGDPAGEAVGANETPWTEERASVRATVDGRYGFVIF